MGMFIDIIRTQIYENGWVRSDLQIYFGSN